MTQDQIAVEFQKLNSKFERIDSRFDQMETRFTERFASIEKHMVTRSDVHMAVFQGLAFAAAAIVGTVVVLNALGAFS